MSSLRILVVLGSMRQGRNGERVSKLLMKKLQDAGHTPSLMDTAVMPNDGKLLQPIHFHRNPDDVPQWMGGINKQIEDCQGLIIVTPEYNATLPPALTAFMDNFPPTSYSHKPVSIATYSMGSFGGIRAAAAARPFLSELKMVSLPSTLTIPEVHNKISEDGECTDERINKNADKLINELAWYSSAICRQIQELGKPN